MTHQTPPEHFKGKNVANHLKDARKRGGAAVSEIHGVEMPGHFSSGAESGKNTAFVFLILWAVGNALQISSKLLFPLFIALGFGWIIWKTGRSALLGWNRLERLHRLIEEERWEIEHHREQEKEELKEMYQAKGFTGKLLDDVVDVLMSDDNTLLRVMLEEELGLSLEIYEHPLKQAFGAFIGAFVSTLCCIFGLYFWPLIGVPLAASILLIIASNLTARYEKRKQLASIIWNLALALFSVTGAYFLARLITQ